ncbi:MAG: peptidoglycan-binding domain-containing protein [Candidatus Paceibacterota bacterium]|jgi:hypothetical protein
MIKKYIAATVGLLLAMPFTALAAADDVTLTTDVSIVTGGVTFNVSGSSATISTLSVNASNFAVTLGNGSSVTVKTADSSQIGDDAPSANLSSSTCVPGNSTKTYTATGVVTVTVFPTSIICSSGSGGSSTPTPTPVVSSGGGSVSTTPVITIPAVVPPVVVPPVVVPPVTQTPNVPAIVNANPSKVAVAVSPVFTRALAKNQTHADAKRLQQLLSLDLGVAVKTTGKFDTATQNALKKFQVKYKIAKSGQVGYGTFGPATRAKMAELFELQKSVVAATSSTSASRLALIKTLLDKIKELQAQLKLMQ